MRYCTILCFLLALIAVPAFAQQKAILYCQFPQFAKTGVTINQPINKAFVQFGARPLGISAAGATTIMLDSSETGYLVLSAGDRSIHLYIQPGDTIQVAYDTTQSQPLSIKGKNFEGQYLLNSGQLPITGSNALYAQFAKDTSLEMLVTHAEMEKSAMIGKVGALYDRRVITEDFLNFVKRNLDYVYALAIANTIRVHYDKAMNGAEPVRQTLPGFTATYGKYWTLLFDALLPTDSTARGMPALYDYASVYLEAYLMDYIGVLKGAAAKHSDPVPFIQQYMKGEIGTIVLATRLYKGCLQPQSPYWLNKGYQLLSVMPGAKSFIPYLEPLYKKRGTGQ